MAQGDLLAEHNSLTGGDSQGGSGSAPREQTTGQKEIASSCIWGGLDWIL